MTKKEIATTFLQLVSAGTVDEAFERFIRRDFKHHLLYFRGDRQSLLEAMKESAREFPDKTYEVIRALEDGDSVAVHGKVVLASKVYAVIHILRFEDDKIVESWEASQEELGDSPNEHGLF
ncbi:MAG: nuclear transport factor 2 family protein [Bacteroidota bacterium]